MDASESIVIAWSADAAESRGDAGGPVEDRLVVPVRTVR
jgi:hypothetical protein